MNLGSIISGLLGLVFGKKNWEDWRMSSTEGEDNYTDFGGTLDNVLAKYSGSRLTNAEQQANAFSAQQSELAFQREADFQREMFDKQTELANTQYQRTVADMRAAGINPMMAAKSSGAAVPSGGSASSSAPQSVSPGSMGNIFPSILNAILRSKEIKMQERALQADIDLKDSEAERNRAEARNANQQYDYFEQVKGIRAEAERLSNFMSEARIVEIHQGIKESKARTDNAVEQALLARANAHNIEYMQPFLSAYYDSMSTKNEADAALAVVEAAYKQGLIDEGAIRAAVRESNARASEAEVNAEVNKFVAALKEKENNNTPDLVKGSIGQKIVAGVSAISKSIQGKF